MKIKTLFACLAMCVANMSFSQLMPIGPIYHFYQYERGLVAHYPLSGNLDDYSGYENHGILGPNVEVTTVADGFEDKNNPNDAGNPNGCMQVQPASENDYFFRIPNKPQINPTSNMCISLRFAAQNYDDPVGTQVVLVSKGTQYEIGYTIVAHSEDSVRFYYRMGNTTIQSKPIHLVAGDWYMLAANLKSEAEVVSQNEKDGQVFSSMFPFNNPNALNQGMSLFFYWNFYEDGPQNMTPIAWSTVSVPVSVNTDPVTVCGGNFSGKFDALRIYNRALFPDEIGELIRLENYEPTTMSKPAPPLAYETKLYSSWKSEAGNTFNGTINRSSVFAQSFRATTPFIKSISINTGTCNVSGKVRFEIYTFNTDAVPIYQDKKSPLGRPLFSGVGDINNLTASCDKWDFMPYLKVGSKYIVKVYLNNGTNNTCTNDQKIHLFFSTRDIYGEGIAYEFNSSLQKFVPILNGFNSVDMNMEISGGYPMKDTKELYMMDTWNWSNTFNRTAASCGQTFMATAPLLRKVIFNNGGTSGKARINIYEYSGNTSAPKGNKIGEECVADLFAYTKSTFDWEGTGKAMPGLKVGREYYLEISKYEGGTATIHYYGNSDNNYNYKGSFGSSTTSGTSFTAGIADVNTDLNMTIIGMDPKLTEEDIFSEWANPATALTGSVFKQTFIATTNYVSEVIIGSCYAYNDLQVSIQEMSEGLSGSKAMGTIDGLYNGIENSTLRVGSGCTYHFRFKYPVKLEIGKKYYLTIKRASGGTFDLLSKGENLQRYGTQLFINGSEYLYASQSASLNLRMKGLKTGHQYYGPTTMVNGGGGYSDNRGMRVGAFRDELKFKWVRGDAFIDRLYTVPDNLSTEVWSFDNTIEELQKKGGGILLILRSDLEDDERKYYPFNDNNWLNSSQKTAYINKLIAFAQRYKGKPVIYEIFNEPNGKISTSNQITLIKDFSNAIKTGDPDALVCTGSWSSVGINWDDLYQNSTQIINAGVGNNGGLGAYADFFSYHPYWQDLPELGTTNWNYTRKLDFVRNNYNFTGTTSAPAIRNLPAFISSEFGVFAPLTDNEIDIVMNDPQQPQKTAEANNSAQKNASLDIYIPTLIDFYGRAEYSRFKILKNYYNGSPAVPSGTWGFVRNYINPKIPIFEIRVGTIADNIKIIDRRNNSVVLNSTLGMPNYPYGTKDNSGIPYPNGQGETRFRFPKSAPLELEYDVEYQVVLKNNLGADVTSYTNLKTGSLKKGFLWGEAFCESMTNAISYWERYNLFQLKNGVQTSVNYAMAWGGPKGTSFTHNPFDQGDDGFSCTPNPTAYFIKRYNDLFKYAVNVPHFSIAVVGDFTQLPDVMHVAKIDPVRDELVIAVWRAKSLTYQYPMTTSLIISSDEYSGEAMAYSQLTSAPGRENTIACQQGITKDLSQPGKFILNNLQISEKPLYLRIKRKGNTFVLNPQPSDVNFIEEDCDIGTCKF